jgi:hypothetical protein
MPNNAGPRDTWAVQVQRFNSKGEPIGKPSFLHEAGSQTSDFIGNSIFMDGVEDAKRMCKQTAEAFVRAFSGLEHSLVSQGRLSYIAVKVAASPPPPPA